MPKMRAVQVVEAEWSLRGRLSATFAEPGPGEIRVKVEACGVCHSDAVTRSGAYPGLTLPRVPGHEIAGRVDAVGPTSRRGRRANGSASAGTGVTASSADPCRKGDFINCEKAQITGVTLDGGYAEYAVVPHEAVARHPGRTRPRARPARSSAPASPPTTRCATAARDRATPSPCRASAASATSPIQYAARMGFRTVAISRGVDKKALARSSALTSTSTPRRWTRRRACRRLGGADLVLATAPHSAAIASTVNGLKARGKLLIVAAPFEPLQIPALSLLSGKSIAGWPSGSAIDSEETVAFSALTHVRPRIEKFPLEKAEEAFGRAMANRVRFRAVLVP